MLVLPGDRPGDAPLWGLLVLIARGVLLGARLVLRAAHRACRATCSPRRRGRCSLGGLATLVVALVAGEGGDVHPSQFSTDSILALVYLVLVGSLVAYTAYTWLLRNAPISKVATYAYVNPVDRDRASAR